MKKIILFFTVIFSALSLGANAQTEEPTFRSAKQIREFLKKNIDNIDPIEGEYHVKRYFKSGSPIDPSDSTEFTYYIVTDPKTKFLSLYAKDQDGFHPSDNVWFNYTDSSTVYKMYWHNSCDSISLEEDNTVIKATIKLSDEDAKAFANNPDWKPWITLTYYMKKIFPKPDDEK